MEFEGRIRRSKAEQEAKELLRREAQAIIERDEQ